MTAGPKVNSKGRNVGRQRFVMLNHWAFDGPSYRSLKPGPRALLWEFIRLYNGGNNGRIGFSQRQMSATINVADRETVAGYVRELEAKGFIKAQRRGGFNVKVAKRRATEWALTMFSIGEELATKDFVRWRPGKNGGTEIPTTKDGKPVPSGVNDVPQRSNVREFLSAKAVWPADFGAENPSTYTSIAIGTAKHRTAS